VPKKSLRTLIIIWLAWAAILIVFQNLVPMRLALRKPDYVLGWTFSETNHGSQNDKPYLIDPFMNQQVSWDAEYYLSIANGGYEDPIMRRIPIRGTGDVVSQNYAFFPLYPHVMRVVMIPLGVLGLTPIATATLAGVIVALVGTLFGMIGLYDLAREELGEDGAIRTAFYLLIFPSGFFLAQVYTEGLFIGLAFCSLALMRRQHVWAAAILAVFTVWTRAVGVALIIPLALAWYKSVAGQSFDGRAALRGLSVLLPVAAYVVWSSSVWGVNFRLVEENFFGRGLLLVESSWQQWQIAWNSIGGDNTQATMYYVLETGAVLLALMACLLTLKHYPGVALFGLAALAIAVFSGWPQSMIRYVLVIPSIFMVLSRLGKWPAFDRAWTLASVLLLGVLTTLYTFDMWVA
jgi:hypothetical protein